MGLVKVDASTDNSPRSAEECAEQGMVGYRIKEMDTKLQACRVESLIASLFDFLIGGVEICAKIPI